MVKVQIKHDTTFGQVIGWLEKGYMTYFDFLKQLEYRQHAIKAYDTVIRRSML